jgi:hypothetical protein
MGFDASTDRLISIKKLAGKSHTSNEKGLSNEGLPSGVTISSETVFGETITSAPSSTALYTITGKVEYLRFPASFVVGSDSGSGRHGFALQLPADYESQSSNSKKGTYPFENNQVVNITSGSLQLIPTSFASSYEVKPYYGGNTVKDSGTQIPVLDARDWYVDYFNGVFFQQDPPGAGDHANNPDFVEGYLYIGDPLSTVVAAAGGDTFKTIVVSGQTDVVADSSTDTLTLVGGSNVTITTNAGTDTVTIAASTGGTLTGIDDQTSGNEDQLTITDTAIILNADKDDLDLEVRADAAGKNLIHAFGQSGSEQVLILSGGSSVDSLGYGTDTGFFVSGTLGAMGTHNSKGTSVFGGDLLVSGTVSLARTADSTSADGLLMGVGPGALSSAFSTTDTCTWFSGSIGGKDHVSDRGVTVFGGDVAASGSILPGLDTTTSLGSPTNRWANVYTGDLHLKNRRGDWTIFEEADFLCVVNNSTGKKFKMVLEPLD